MMTYDPEHDCFVGTFPMPAAIKAYIRYRDADRFIYVNDSLSPEARKAAYEHELLHLRRDDLNASEPVQVIEGTVHHLVDDANPGIVPQVDPGLPPEELRNRILSNFQHSFFLFRGNEPPALADLELACRVIRDVRRAQRQ